jgi:large conductance mechanosensitive channel
MTFASLLIDRIILFLGLGLVLYGIASFYGLVTNDSIISHTTKCAYCRKTVSVKV